MVMQRYIHVKLDVSGLTCKDHKTWQNSRS